MQVTGLFVIGAVIAVAACSSSAPASPDVTPSAIPSEPRSVPAPTGTPLPTATAPGNTPTAAGLPLPSALLFRWVGETRTIPDAAPPVVESTMQVTPDTWTFYATEDGSHPLAISQPSIDSDGNLRLEFKGGTAPCAKGDEGTYAFDVSSTERGLDLNAVDDPCAQRAAAMSGSWTRSACPTNHLCLGDLDPGPHVSVIYTPLVRFPEWHYTYGRFGYTVPDGWTNPEDNQDGYVLLPRDAPDGTGIYVFSDVLPHEQEHDPATHKCLSEPAEGQTSYGPNVYDWIKSLDGLEVTNDQADVEVGGLHGSSVDLAVSRAWKGTCGWPGEQPGRPLFVNAQTTPEEGLDWGINGDGRMRLFILTVSPSDIGQPAQNVLVDIEAPDKPTFDALVPEAMPIVESMAFNP